MVLVRPRPRRVEEERLALLVAGAEAAWSTPHGIAWTRSGGRPSSSIARRRTNWLGTITASALRAERSCVRARQSRSAREKSSGWSRCCRSWTVTAVGSSSEGSAIVSG